MRFGSPLPVEALARKHSLDLGLIYFGDYLSGVGHCRNTWRLGTEGTLGSWELYAHFAVGHCRAGEIQQALCDGGERQKS